MRIKRKEKIENRKKRGGERNKKEINGKKSDGSLKLECY